MGGSRREWEQGKGLCRDGRESVAVMAIAKG